MMKKIFLDWILPIIVALVLSAIINKYVFTIATFPSKSMEPTIMEGDRLFVTRVYNPEKLKTGDIVVLILKKKMRNL